jgi:predicted ester cyclase
MSMPEPGQIEQDKDLVRRFIDEVMNAGRLDLLDTFYSPELAPTARRWIEPFRVSFPDMRMEIVDLIAEDDKVVGWFRCSGTHLGDWLGHAPTGKRFTRVDEVYFFRIENGRIVHAWGIEDTLRRLKQLGLS